MQTPIASNNTIIPFIVGTTYRASQIRFYTYTGEMDKLNKQYDKNGNAILNLLETISGQFRNVDIDVVNPTITIDMAVFTTDVLNQANYVYINDFKRYYYIKSKTITNTLLTLELEVDVLYTYYSYIINLSGIIDRGGTSPSQVLLDSNIPISSVKDIEVVEYQNDFFQMSVPSNVNEENIILSVLGQPGDV